MPISHLSCIFYLACLASVISSKYVMVISSVTHGMQFLGYRLLKLKNKTIQFMLFGATWNSFLTQKHRFSTTDLTGTPSSDTQSSIQTHQPVTISTRRPETTIGEVEGMAEEPATGARPAGSEVIQGSRVLHTIRQVVAEEVRGRNLVDIHTVKIRVMSEVNGKKVTT